MNNAAVLANINAEDAIPHSEEDPLKFPALSCQIKSSNLTCLVGPHRFQLRIYLQMLAGITKPEQGKVQIFGQQIAELDQLAWRNFRCQIGYLSGSSPLLSTQHGLMNVMLPALYHRNSSFRETADKARALLADFDCQFELTTFPALLNSFQRAQLALARAIILDPPVLILDLPFNDLGAKEREKMGILLAKYQQNRAVCMVGGLQYPHFLEQYAQQIIFISEYKIINFDGWKSFMQTKDSDVQELLNVL